MIHGRRTRPCSPHRRPHATHAPPRRGRRQQPPPPPSPPPPPTRAQPTHMPPCHPGDKFGVAPSGPRPVRCTPISYVPVSGGRAVPVTLTDAWSDKEGRHCGPRECACDCVLAGGIRWGGPAGTLGFVCAPRRGLYATPSQNTPRAAPCVWEPFHPRGKPRKTPAAERRRACGSRASPSGPDAAPYTAGVYGPSQRSSGGNLAAQGGMPVPARLPYGKTRRRW